MKEKSLGFMMINPVVQVVFHKEDSLLCHKIEMMPIPYEFPSKEIRCPDEQKAIRHMKLKSPRCTLDHDSGLLLHH